jgi:serine/threonine protein kinase
MDQQKVDSIEIRESAELLDGRYELLEKLGSGGMGEVYKAKQLSTGRVVAIKFVSSASAQDQIRFQNEAKALSGLSHPNLISVIDYGIDADGRQYLVMDYVSGKSLDNILETQHTLSGTQFRDIFGQVCRGLMHAHAAGIVHRDLKPSNVMITEESDGRLHVTVVDFGIAKPLAANTKITQTGDVIGSPAYMSPEQAMGYPVDARTDIYSLGCMMYEAATGSVPFSGDNPFEIVVKRVGEPAPRFTKVLKAGTFDPVIESIVMKALEREPQNRFSTAAELYTALQSPDAVPRIRPRNVKGTKIAAAVALASVICGAAAGFWFMSVRPNTTAPPPISDAAVESRLEEYGSLMRLSDEQRLSSKHAEGKESLHKAIATLGSEIEKPTTNKGEIYLRLGIFALEDKQYGAAEAYLNTAREACEKVPDHFLTLGQVLGWQAQLASIRGDHDLAAKRFNESAAVYDQAPGGEMFGASARWQYGNELRVLRQYKEARAVWTQAREAMLQLNQLGEVKKIDVALKMLRR